MICGRESGILMVPVMSLKACNIVSDYNDEFKNLLSKLNSDKVGDYIKKRSNHYDDRITFL